MKVEAYMCDHCGELKHSAEVVAISEQPDMFDTMSSYPISGIHLDRYNIHLCTECYNNYAAIPAAREVNRARNEEGYKLKLKELAYMVRSQCVANYNKKVRGKVARNK